jgi:hypothetical protein
MFGSEPAEVRKIKQSLHAGDPSSKFRRPPGNTGKSLFRLHRWTPLEAQESLWGAERRIMKNFLPVSEGKPAAASHREHFFQLRIGQAGTPVRCRNAGAAYAGKLVPHPVFICPRKATTIICIGGANRSDRRLEGVFHFSGVFDINSPNNSATSGSSAAPKPSSRRREFGSLGAS